MSWSFAYNTQKRIWALTKGTRALNDQAMILEALSDTIEVRLDFFTIRHSLPRAHIILCIAPRYIKYIPV